MLRRLSRPLGADQLVFVNLDLLAHEDAHFKVAKPGRPDAILTSLGFSRQGFAMDDTTRKSLPNKYREAPNCSTPPGSFSIVSANPAKPFDG